MLFTILMFCLEGYCLFLLLFLIATWIKGERLALDLYLLNAAVLALFVFIKQKIFDHQLVFTGSYTGNDHWSAGMSNMVTSIFNIALLFATVFFSQLCFWIAFRKANRLFSKRI